jgi:hypothetical protein
MKTQTMMRVGFLVLAGLLAVSTASKFSVYYVGPDSSSSLISLTASSSPSPEHLADIVCRLNGLPPILIENKINMPQLDILLGKHTPLIIELTDAGI